MIRDLFMIELAVADWRAAFTWYRDTLGLDVEMLVERDRFALLRGRKGTRLALKEGQPVPGSLLLHFEVDNLDADLERLESLEVQLEGAVKVSPEGYRRAIIRDLDGYRLCLFEWLNRR